MGAAAVKMAFVIEGPWMTEFVHARVLEGRWDHAVETLNCLEGITMDQILSILKGEAKLTGCTNTEINMEADWDLTYMEDLEQMFVGTYVDSNGRYLRPYAYVTSWGPEDNAHGANITKGSDSMRDRRGNEKAGCSLFYADDPARDVVRCVKFERHDNELGGMRKDGTSIVLFKEIPNFPFQIVRTAGLDNAQKAMDEYIKAGNYPKEVGYSHTFPPQFYRVRYDVEDPTESRPEGNRTHMEPLGEEAQYDAKVIGRARFDKINAEKNGVPIEDWQDYQERISGKDSIIDQHMKMIRQAEEVQGDFEKDRIHYMNAIIEQAGDNWLTIGTIDGKNIKVPLAPFENWCLWRGDGAHLALPWTTVCPSGLKMFGDDPYHTDFLIGAGLDLDAMADHDSPLSRLVWDMRQKIQEEKLGFKVAVLCGTGQSQTLKAVHPKRGEECKPDEVAIIPNAGPHYVAAAMTAGAVICEQGGAMAHLVTVSREKDVKIVRVENARKLYPVGMHLVVDCQNGEVRVPFNRQDYKMKLGGQVIDVDKLGEE